MHRAEDPGIRRPQGVLQEPAEELEAEGQGPAGGHLEVPVLPEDARVDALEDHHPGGIPGDQRSGHDHCPDGVQSPTCREVEEQEPRQEHDGGLLAHQGEEHEGRRAHRGAARAHRGVVAPECEEAEEAPGGVIDGGDPGHRLHLGGVQGKEQRRDGRAPLGPDRRARHPPEEPRREPEAGQGREQVEGDRDEVEAEGVAIGRGATHGEGEGGHRAPEASLGGGVRVVEAPVGLHPVGEGRGDRPGRG